MAGFRYCLALALLFITSSTGAETASPAPQLETRVLAAINDVRGREGLQPLRRLPALEALARDHSRYMFSAGELSHRGAGGAELASRVGRGKIDYRMVGENVAMNYNQPRPAATAVDGWLRSPGHRANILERQFTHTGVGVVGDGKTYYFTQIFLRPAED